MPVTTISFKPLQAVRPDIPGEGVFVRAYQRLVGGKHLKVYHITDEPRSDDFYGLGEYRTQSLAGWWPHTSFHTSMARANSFPENLSLAAAWQRRANVATSFMKWLGTNEGLRLLDEAEQLQQILETTQIRPTLGTYRADIYAMAWARRISQTDGNVRYAVLAESHGRDHAGFLAVNKASCSMDDIRVLEEMTCWLGTPIGQKYLQSCRKTLDRKLKNENRKRHAADNLRCIATGLPPQPSITQAIARTKCRATAPSR